MKRLAALLTAVGLACGCANLPKESSVLVDDIVHRCFGDEFSLFSNGKFSMWTQASAEQMEDTFTEFGGFAEVDEHGLLQCLFGLDVPRRALRIAVLLQGYGGSPPKAVTEWIKTG